MSKILRKLHILKTLEQMKDKRAVPIFIPLQKQLIQKLDTESLFDFFEVLTDNTDYVQSYRNRIGFDYLGFGKDEEEIFKMESVRRFLQAVQQKFPYMFWFGVKRIPERGDSLFLKGYLYSQCRFTLEKDMGDYFLRELNESDLTNFLHSSELGVRELQKKYGLGEPEVMDCFIDVAEYLKKNIFRSFQLDRWSQNFN
jgi:superfamily I DNA/RNA helicase